MRAICPLTHTQNLSHFFSECCKEGKYYIVYNVGRRTEFPTVFAAVQRLMHGVFSLTVLFYKHAVQRAEQQTYNGQGDIR